MLNIKRKVNHIFDYFCLTKYYFVFDHRRVMITVKITLINFYYLTNSTQVIISELSLRFVWSF